MDVEAKAQAEAVRCVSLEKESRTFEELMRLRGKDVLCCVLFYHAIRCCSMSSVSQLFDAVLYHGAFTMLFSSMPFNASS